MTKPRLSMRTVIREGIVDTLWTCRSFSLDGSECPGWGVTPEKAYIDWMAWRTYRVGMGLPT